jgi:WhiB family redox-sensing transcriptional regulator
MNRRALTWLTDEAACIGVHINVFYGDTTDLNTHAKKLCATCPLVEACLRHALENGEYGVWGMTDEKERKQLGGKPAQANSRGVDHGSPHGARAHYRRNEKPCGPCLDAQRLRDRTRKAS